LGADHEWSSDPGEYLHALFRNYSFSACGRLGYSNRHRIGRHAASENPSGHGIKAAAACFIPKSGSLLLKQTLSQCVLNFLKIF